MGATTATDELPADVSATPTDAPAADDAAVVDDKKRKPSGIRGLFGNRSSKRQTKTEEAAAAADEGEKKLPETTEAPATVEAAVDGVLQPKPVDGMQVEAAGKAAGSAPDLKVR